jgi:hypothetical protein
MIELELLFSRRVRNCRSIKPLALISDRNCDFSVFANYADVDQLVRILSMAMDDGVR